MKGDECAEFGLIFGGILLASWFDMLLPLQFIRMLSSCLAPGSFLDERHTVPSHTIRVAYTVQLIEATSHIEQY